jgi:transcriptional regulator with XRE-family HTH domain
MTKGIRISGKKLAALRDAKRFSQSDLSRELGVQRETVWRYEQQDVVGVMPAVFRKMLGVLGAGEGELLAGEGPMPKRVKPPEKPAIPEDLWDRLKQAAALLGTTPEALVVDFVARVERKAKPPRIKHPRRKLRHPSL